MSKMSTFAVLLLMLPHLSFASPFGNKEPINNSDPFLVGVTESYRLHGTTEDGHQCELKTWVKDSNVLVANPKKFNIEFYLSTQIDTYPGYYTYRSRSPESLVFPLRDGQMTIDYGSDLLRKEYITSYFGGNVLKNTYQFAPKRMLTSFESMKIGFNKDLSKIKYVTAVYTLKSLIPGKSYSQSHTCIF